MGGADRKIRDLSRPPGCLFPEGAGEKWGTQRVMEQAESPEPCRGGRGPGEAAVPKDGLWRAACGKQGSVTQRAGTLNFQDTELWDVPRMPQQNKLAACEA